MGGIGSKLCPQDVSTTVLLTRYAKYIGLGAGLYSVDWISDLLAVDSFCDSGSWMFGVLGVAILIVNPTLTWAFMVKQKASSLSITSYLSYVIPWHVWQQAFDAVERGESNFEMAFITVAEAPMEAFPQSLLQSYSLLIGLFNDVGDKSVLGVPKILVMKMSVCISFASMAKSMTTFDFYGQEGTSMLTWMLQATHRLAVVAARILTVAFFGALLRPQGADLHQNVNYLLPCVLLFGLLSNLAIMVRYIDIELPLLWAIFCMLGPPPLFLAAFDPTRKPLVFVRCLEFVVMIAMVGMFVETPVTEFLNSGILAYVCIGSIGLLLLTTLLLALTEEANSQTDYSRLIDEPNEEEARDEERHGGRQSDALIKASEAGDAFLVRILAKLADCNAANIKGVTPVSAAKSAEIMEIFTTSGKVDWNISGHRQKLLTVIAGNELEVTQVMVAGGASINEALNAQGQTAVSTTKSAEMIKMLASESTIDWKLPEHRQMLLTAIRKSDAGMLEAFCKAGADVASPDAFAFPIDCKTFSVLLSYMGPVCISGSHDTTLMLWDVTTGKCLKTLKGHSGIVCAVAALGVDKCISGSSDATLKLWDLSAGECLKTLEGHSSHVMAAAALGVDKCISGSMDKTLKLWDLSAGQCLKTLKGHRGHVYAVAALGVEKCISGSGDNTLKLWDLSVGVCLRTLDEHSDYVYAVAALGVDKCISGSEDKTLKLWDLSAGASLKTLEGHSSRVYAVAALGLDKCISGSNDNTLKLWDLSAGECLKTLEGHDQPVRAVAALGVDKCISGSPDNTLKLWDLSVGECLKTLEGHSGHVYAVAALGVDKCISGSEDTIGKFSA